MYRMVFIKIFRGLIPVICFVTILQLFSCSSYRTMNIEIMKPAKVYLAESGKWGYWDRNIRKAADTSFVLYDYEGISPDQLSLLFYTGINEGLVENGNTDTIPVLYGKLVTFVAEEGFPMRVLPEQLKEIGRDLGLSHIVVLENYTYQLKPEKHQTGCRYYIRLYSCSTGEVLDSLIYTENLTECLYVGDFQKYMQWLAHQRGREYIQRFFPCWVADSRRIYNGGKVLRTGDYLFTMGNTEEALKLWKAVTCRKPHEALKGYLNIAWFYEDRGEFEMAKETLLQAWQLVDKNHIQNRDVDYLNAYLKSIDVRIQDKKLLDKQLQ